MHRVYITPLPLSSTILGSQVYKSLYEQAFVNNEVWLPTYVEAHFGARFLLVKGFKGSVVTRYSDYKRFNVETLSTIATPKGAAEAPADPPRSPSKT